MKRIWIGLCLAALVILVAVISKAAWDRFGWVEYRPIVFSEEKDALVHKPELMKTAYHTEAMFLVLSRYGEPFRYKPGPPERIYITRQLAADEDLLWNFTSKAELLRKGGHLNDFDTWWNLPKPRTDNAPE